MKASNLQKEIKKLANAEKKKVLQRFFKTGKGQYAEGDRFHGVVVPQTRKLAKKYQDLPLLEINKLLHSIYHEERLAALVILNLQYEAGNIKSRTKIFKYYLKNSIFINNWDLVDISAPNIIGQHLLAVSLVTRLQLLQKLASSPLLWERRIAVVACLTFIRHHEFAEILTLAELLLHDQEDLIHKAVGWMLREMGKRDVAPLLQFLDNHAYIMPRTMLRYSLEKLAPKQKKYYMSLFLTKN